MELREKFGVALKAVRKRKGITQEDFSDVSSRTYMSTLERGLKSPTLEKIDQLANVLGVHPVSLVALTYLQSDKDCTLEQLMDRIRHECEWKDN